MATVRREERSVSRRGPPLIPSWTEGTRPFACVVSRGQPECPNPSMTEISMSDSIVLDLQPGALVAVLAGNPEGVVFARNLLMSTSLGFQLVLLTDQPPSEPDDRCVQWPIDASSLRRLTNMLTITDGPRLGLVCGWPGLLPSAFINLFRGRLLNVHSGDLPRYRGAGGGSWQVLNDERAICADVQQMWANIDAGPILLRERVELPSRPYPSDVKIAAKSGSRAVLKRLAECLIQGGRWPLRHQDQSCATYFPRLSTVENGWIDFSWTAVLIERFIRAFSDPHEGASFRHGEGMFRVRRADVRVSETAFHPFSAGLITNKSPGVIEVVTSDGILSMSDLRLADGKPAADSLFKIGGRCYSTAADLLSSRVYRPRSGLPISDADNPVETPSSSAP